MSTPPYDITGLVLAGGDSTRMGRPKPHLYLGEETLVGRALNLISPLCREVIIVTRRPTDFLSHPVKVVRDLGPGQGPLGGLATGLFYASYPWALTLACDIPFLNAGILQLLLEKSLEPPRGPHAVVPRTDKGWQPLAALYSKACFRPIQRLLAQGARKIDLVKNRGVLWEDLPEHLMRAIDPDLHSFFNINTPEDLNQAQSEFEHQTDRD